jgi:hypothetical protein
LFHTDPVGHLHSKGVLTVAPVGQAMQVKSALMMLPAGHLQAKAGEELKTSPVPKQEHVVILMIVETYWPVQRLQLAALPDPATIMRVLLQLQAPALGSQKSLLETQLH